jgi:hypothetical protein
LLSELIAISRFVLPAGLVPTTVPGRGVNEPVAPIAKPEMVAEPAFEVKTNWPLGVMACQQVAAANVGTLVLMGVSTPLARIE